MDESKGRKMIEIIKRGTKKIAKCNYCGCEFSYEEEDIQHYEHGRYNEYELVEGVKHGYKKYVVCPQCKKEFVVEQTK